MVLAKIVSGGQTGVDRGALDAALQRGFPCGGWCPPGRKAEDGPISESYALVEMSGGGYRERTIQNVVDSDGTAVLYFGELSGGTEQTMLHCIRQKKPYRLIDACEISPERAAVLVVEFIRENAVATINVAGPRASKVPSAYAYAVDFVRCLLVGLDAAVPRRRDAKSS